MEAKHFSALLLASCVVVCLGVGFLLGRKSVNLSERVTASVSGNDVSGVAAGFSDADGEGVSRYETIRVPIPENGFTKEKMIALAQEMSESPGFGPEKMRQMLSVHEALRRQDAGILVRELMEEEGNFARQALYLAMSAYAEQAPGPALELALANASDQTMRGVLYQVVQSNMKIDPHGTFERLKQVEDRQVRSQIINTALSVMASTDPDQAFQLYLANQSSMAGGVQGVSGMFHQWARNDPRAAAAALAKIPDADTRNQAASNLVNGWAQNDPEAAWNWALQQPVSGETYNDPRVRLLNVWAHQDPEKALDKALTLNSRELQNSVLPNIVQQWANKDVDAALSWVLTLEDSTLLAQSLRQVAYSDSVPPGPLFDILVRNMPAGNTFESAVSSVMSRWAREDPASAAAALRSLPMGDAFSNGAGSLVGEWSKSDPGEAFRWVMSLPDGAARENTLGNFFSNSVQSDSGQALEFFSKLPPGEQKRYANNIVYGLASQDIDKAIQFSSTIADANVRKNAYSSIGNTWARNDPQGAGEWALSLGPDERSEVVSDVVRSWSNVNIEEAAAWLASKPESSDLDEATVQLSRNLVGVDPMAAIDWAGAVVDDKKRQRNLYRVAQSWKRYDPQAAQAWIRTSNQLTSDQKEKLLK